MYHRIICSCCGRDIDSLYQDNMSYDASYSLCEDCFVRTTFMEYEQNQEQPHRRLSRKQFKFLMRYAGWSYIKTKHARYDDAVKKIGQIIYRMRGR